MNVLVFWRFFQHKIESLYCTAIRLAIWCAFCGFASVSCMSGGLQNERAFAGHWSPVNINSAAKALDQKLIDSGLADDFFKTHGRFPVLVVGYVENRAPDAVTEHDMQLLSEDLAFYLRGQKNVTLLYGSPKSATVFVFSSVQDAGNYAAVLGADMMLQGSVSTQIIDGTKKYRAVRQYAVSLDLVACDSGKMLWSGIDDEVRKDIRQIKK